MISSDLSQAIIFGVDNSDNNVIIRRKNQWEAWGNTYLLLLALKTDNHKHDTQVIQSTHHQQKKTILEEKNWRKQVSIRSSCSVLHIPSISVSKLLGFSFSVSEYLFCV